LVGGDRHDGRGAMKRSGILGHQGLTSIFAALLFAGGLAACAPDVDEGKSAERAVETPRAVRTAKVEMRPLTGGLAASGVLIAREEAAVGSELAGYRVARVLKEEGSFVRAGEPLVVLDDALIRAQIDQASANLQQQRVAAQQREREAERVRGLDAEGILAREAVEERRFGAESARAGVAASQAQVAELRTRQSRLTIRAPVSGVVLERNVRPGDISGAGGEPYFRIARGGLIELDAEVSEAVLPQIRGGDRARVTLPSGQVADGVVRLVSPVVDPQTRLGRVRVLLSPGPGQRPGGFGRAEFNQVQQSAPAVPEAAVRFDADGASLMVVGAGNKVSRVPVRTGRRANGYVELVQGPPAGSQVLLGGAAFVLEGDIVRPVGANAPLGPTPQGAG
jgi:HlyD family secretion protein